MTTISSNVEKATEIAKQITKNAKFTSALKKTARSFLKRAKSKRESAVEGLVAAVAEEMGLGVDATLELSSKAVKLCDFVPPHDPTPEPAPEPASATPASEPQGLEPTTKIGLAPPPRA